MSAPLEVELAVMVALQRLSTTASGESAVHLRLMADEAERQRPGLADMAQRFHPIGAGATRHGRTFH
jgi:hypothetical protein